jgi:hypothetical protein
MAQDLTQYADRVVLVGPNFEYDGSLPRLLMRAELTHNPGLVRAHLVPDTAQTDKLFRTKAMPDRVTYLSVFDVFCQPDCVNQTAAGVPVNFDDNHLSPDAAAILAQSAELLPKPSIQIADAGK